MLVKKHLLILVIIGSVFLSCSGILWAATQVKQRPAPLHSATESMKTAGQRNSSAATGKIDGKVADTSGLPLSGITISLQELTGETIYRSSFEDKAITDGKGKFRIDGLAPGNYIVRASPPSGEFYLPNDKFNVLVKSNKKKRLKIILSAAPDDNASYTGSAVCLGCHPNQNDWKDTAHANTILPPSEETIVAPFPGNTITTSDGKVKFKPVRENNAYKVTLYDLTNESVSVTYTIARTHGGVALAGKQRYHVKIGGSHYILPIQYNNRNVDASNPDAAWVSYNPGNWYKNDGALITTDKNIPPNKNKSFEQNCEGCHVTGLSITRNADGEFVSGSNEPGISCESCHGPGERHVSEGGGKARYIVNPAYLATDRGNEVCGQCHIRVKNKTGKSGADFETEYPCVIDGEEVTPFIPGKILKDYIEETGSDGKATAGYWNDNDIAILGENASENNHSIKHHQQYQDLIKSRHYNNAGHTCYTCHEPHGKGKTGTAQLLRESDNNKICTNCHGDLAMTNKKDGNLQNKHAKHPYSSSNAGGSLCIGCHMPKTAKSGVDNDISSHVLDIIKPYTSKAIADINTASDKPNNPSTVITNSCYGCHTEDTDYGVERWDTWEKED